MGFWSGIKHALNSTLGTEDFKPLDRLMYEGKALQPSDELYYLLKDYVRLNKGETLKLPFSLAFKTFGSINVSCQGTGSAASYGHFAIYKNGENIANILFGTGVSFNETKQTTISISPNDVLTFECINSSSALVANITFNNMQINAKVVDTSAISLKEG